MVRFTKNDNEETSIEVTRNELQTIIVGLSHLKQSWQQNTGGYEALHRICTQEIEDLQEELEDEMVDHFYDTEIPMQ